MSKNYVYKNFMFQTFTNPRKILKDMHIFFPLKRRNVRQQNLHYDFWQKK